MPKKAYLSTLGCKVNQFETASFTSEFEERGLVITGDINEADVIVINTCAVTSKASAQSRREIRQAARKNPTADLVVTGCHAQLAAEELKKLAGIQADRLFIFGNNQKDRLVGDFLNREQQTNRPALSDMQKTTEINRLKVRRFSGRTRAFLRVQDGCNNYCSYCIVPFTRGKSRSLPLEEVLAQARTYAAAGHREIVVTGIHVGLYGSDQSGPEDINQLMESLCLALPTVRFRLSSIEPLEINEKLLTLMKDLDNFMPHLHIPLQSGDNEILALMNRRYRKEQFVDVVDSVREMLPDAAIGIDVLAGFPGESERHFRSTADLLEKLDCTYLHAFPYSKRPGTKAASFVNQTTKEEKRLRVDRLRRISEKKKDTFYRRFIGCRREVLVESERDSLGRLKGFTDNYIPVIIEAETCQPNSIVTVELKEISEDGVKAETAAGI